MLGTHFEARVAFSHFGRAAESSAPTDSVKPRKVAASAVSLVWCQSFVSNKHRARAYALQSVRSAATTIGLLCPCSGRLERLDQWRALQLSSAVSVPFAALMGNSIVKQDNSDRRLQVCSRLPAGSARAAFVASTQSSLSVQDACEFCSIVRGIGTRKIYEVRLLLTAPRSIGSIGRGADD